jgi:hypothetical protein
MVNRAWTYWLNSMDNSKTVAKWKKRTFADDAPTGPKEVRSTTRGSPDAAPQTAEVRRNSATNRGHFSVWLPPGARLSPR